MIQALGGEEDLQLDSRNMQNTNFIYFFFRKIQTLTHI